jgi:hypothetical protein
LHLVAEITTEIIDKFFSNLEAHEAGGSARLLFSDASMSVRSNMTGVTVTTR